MGDLISREALLDVMPKNDFLLSYIVRKDIVDAPDAKIDGNTSDGYHTFNELYHHRAVLFSVIVKAFPERAWKSRKHRDGTMYDGMFIVGIDTPQGQATYHFDLYPYWEMFKCPELEYAREWDGHSPLDAITRIGSLEPVRHGHWVPCMGKSHIWYCSVCGERINYNQAHRTYKIEKKPVYEVHRWCRKCGAKMEG